MVGFGYDSIVDGKARSPSIDLSGTLNGDPASTHLRSGIIWSVNKGSTPLYVANVPTGGISTHAAQRWSRSAIRSTSSTTSVRQFL